MFRSLPFFFALATLPALAQAPQQPVSPLPRPQVMSTEPIQGVSLRTDSASSFQTVSADANGTEIRLDHGRANVQVYHPAANSQILIDLPGGQVSLLKDGFYTFNADTDIVRVLRGEAESYPSANAKPIKIKEDHELSFAAGAKLKAVEAYPQQIAADVLPGGRETEGYAPRGYGYGPYSEGFYGYPYAPYPYYAYGYPYGYGFGYPIGFGVGFGYYGGFRGGFRR